MHRKTMIVSIAFVVLLNASAIGPCVAATQDPAPIRIETIRAMPYYTEKGVIRTSTDLFDSRLVLRNVVIPAGPTGDPLHRSRIEDWDIVFGTTAVYVDVMISGAEFGKLPRQARLAFHAEAKTSGRTLASQEVLLSTVTVAGSQSLHIPFLVYGTGCEPVELRVQLHDANASVTEVVRTIPFACEE